MKLQGALYPWRFRIVLGLPSRMTGALACRIFDLLVF